MRRSAWGSERMSMSLVKKPEAPARRLCRPTSESAETEKITTRVSGQRERIRLSASMPPIPGIEASISTISGL